jgi:hypothetical protein
MRLLTNDERAVLTEFGDPNDGPIPDSIFQEFQSLGYGKWVSDGFEGVWIVTERGKLALRLDTIAKGLG